MRAGCIVTLVYQVAFGFEHFAYSKKNHVFCFFFFAAGNSTLFNISL